MPSMPARIFFVALALMVAGCHPTGDALDRQLIGDVFTRSELTANLRALCMPGGRLSGSANADVASRFVADKCRECGLKNVHFEPFEMMSWHIKATTVTVLDDG